MPESEITFYCLNSSRSMRVAWALEALHLDYKLIISDRAPNGLAPPEFKAKVPVKLGKFPTISHGGVDISESSAIIEYLCDVFDKDEVLMPKDVGQRAITRMWMSAAEGMFLIHAMAILYARWNMPDGEQDVLKILEEGLSKNVGRDCDWLESTLEEQKAKGSGFLVGNKLSAADIMMQWSMEFIYARKLGMPALGESRFKEIEAWMARIVDTDSYKAAVKRTGYTLEGDFRK